MVVAVLGLRGASFCFWLLLVLKGTNGQMEQGTN